MKLTIVRKQIVVFLITYTQLRRLQSINHEFIKIKLRRRCEGTIEVLGAFWQDAR